MKQKKNYRLVIFDFDGTSFETHLSVHYSFKMTFEKNSLKIPSDKILNQAIATGKGLSNTFELLFDLLKIDVKGRNFNKFVEQYREIYNLMGYKLSTPYKGFIDIIKRLNENKMNLIIVSNKGVDSLNKAIKENLDLNNCFDMIIGSTKNKKILKKPNPMIYTNLIKPKYNEIKPNEILVIGDTSADILFAKNIGAKVAWAKYGYGDKSECESLNPDFTLDEISDLAKYII